MSEPFWTRCANASIRDSEFKSRQTHDPEPSTGSLQAQGIAGPIIEPMLYLTTLVAASGKTLTGLTNIFEDIDFIKTNR